MECIIKNHGVPESQLTKREFLKLCTGGLCALYSAQFFGFSDTVRAQTAKKGLIKTKLSPFYTPLGEGEIRCDLCPRQCHVHKGGRGVCRVRENREGKYYSLVYGNPCAVNLDPIEKKPFLHVLPGTNSLSIATAGCNFDCKFCQNWEIALAFPEEVFSYEMPPEIVLKRAEEMGADSIAYSYVEPTVFYEYMLDTARLARKAGILNVIHTNGYINSGPLRNLCAVLDAAQVDLKGFTNTFYRELCNGELAPVLETLKTLKENQVHLEITNLMIPSKNDDMSLVREMCVWLKNNLGANTPIHFNRFYPLHRLNRLPSTPISTLEKARDAAMSSGLEFVYIGNVPGHAAWNTFCPQCKKMIIQRSGYMIGQMHVKEGACDYCGMPIPGIWDRINNKSRANYST